MAAALVAVSPIAPRAADNFIIVQSTTSTQNSGLFDHLLPRSQMSGVTTCDIAYGRRCCRTSALFTVSSTDSGMSAMPVPDATQATMA